MIYTASCSIAHMIDTSSCAIPSDDEKSEDSTERLGEGFSTPNKSIMYGDVGFYALGTLGMCLCVLLCVCVCVCVCVHAFGRRNFHAQ